MPFSPCSRRLGVGVARSDHSQTKLDGRWWLIEDLKEERLADDDVGASTTASGAASSALARAGCAVEESDSEQDSAVTSDSGDEDRREDQVNVEGWSLLDSAKVVAAARGRPATGGLGARLALALLIVAVLACASGFASKTARRRWAERLRGDKAAFGAQLRRFYLVSDALSGFEGLLQVDRSPEFSSHGASLSPVHQGANASHALVNYVVSDIDEGVGEATSFASQLSQLTPLLPEMMALRRGEQEALVFEARQVWSKLHGYAMQCGDKGACLLDAWGKMESWKGRKAATRKREQEFAFQSIGVSRERAGVNEETSLQMGDRLLAEKWRLESEERQLRMQLEHDEIRYEHANHFEKRKEYDARWRMGFEGIGAWMDHAAAVSFRLVASLCASSAAILLEGRTRGYSGATHAGSHGRFCFLHLGAQLHQVLGSAIGFVTETIVETITGDISEFLGVIELLIVVVSPEILLSFVSVVGLAPFRALMGLPVILIPAHIAVMFCASTSFFFGFLLSRAVSILYPDVEFGGLLVIFAGPRAALVASALTVAWLILRSIVWYEAIAI